MCGERMSYDEFAKIIEMISSHYPKFNLEDYQLKFWYDKLKDYTQEDVIKRFQSHLQGNYAYAEPKLNYLLKNLTTKKEKETEDVRYIECPFCHRKYEFPLERESQERCFTRCSMINYIEEKSQMLNINSIAIFGDDVKRLKLSDIDSKYDKFLLEVYKNKNKLSRTEVYYLKKIIETGNINQEQLEIGDLIDESS